MSDDLVKALRAIDHMSYEDCFLQSPYFIKAADRIEALTAQLESTLRDRKAIFEERDRLRAVLSDIKTASVCSVSRHVAASALGEAAA